MGSPIWAGVDEAPLFALPFTPKGDLLNCYPSPVDIYKTKKVMSADSIDVDLISRIHFCINSNNFLHYARGHRFSRLCSLFDLAKYVSTLSIIVFTVLTIFLLFRTDNTHKSWYRDPGLRKSMISVFVLYLVVSIKDGIVRSFPPN